MAMATATDRLAAADAAQQPASPQSGTARENTKRDGKLSEEVQIQQVGGIKINFVVAVEGRRR
jgi:hypothetical protein